MDFRRTNQLGVGRWRPLSTGHHGISTRSWGRDHGDERHRALTGRQAPEPIHRKLQKIYSNVVAEDVPDAMLALLAELEQKTSETQ